MKTIKAKKSLGQNFLIDQHILHTIADYFDVNGRHILEVGPGYGALTEYLLPKHPKALHLVELDRDMVHILEGKIEKKEFKTEGIDFQIFHQDVLKFEPKFEGKDTSKKGKESIQLGDLTCFINEGQICEGGNIHHKEDPETSSGGQVVNGSKESDYFVIANIPYYITSPILTHFLYTLSNSPEKMLIMMQKEVGERILEGKIENEKGRNKKIKSSVLSLMIAKKCRVEKVCDVPRTSFRPAPKVDSIVLAFEKHYLFQDTSDEIFLDFIKICFSQPRKTLLNNLVSGGYEKEKILLALRELSLSDTVRGEDLSIETMLKLTYTLL